MSKRLLKQLGLICLLTISLSTTIFAAPEETTEVVTQVIKQVEYREAKEEQKAGIYENDTLIIGEDSPEMKALIEKMQESVKLDTQQGLADLKDVIPTKDNITFKNWGEFFFNYVGKEVTEYSGSTITIEFDDVIYEIKASKTAKTWVKETVLPKLIEAVIEESKKYPVSLYKLDIQVGSKLTDLQIEDTYKENVIKLYDLYPLTGKNTEFIDDLIVFNTGVSYGIRLNDDYIEILKGYHNELNNFAKLDKEIPSSVEILAYVTTLKNTKDLTLNDKLLKDMTIYQGLAVNLLTKDLINTNDLTTSKSTLKYSDFLLSEEDLMVVSLQDSIVIVQPKYLECVYVGEWAFSTGYEVDFTEFIRGNGTQVSVTSAMFDSEMSDVSIYTNLDGILGVTKGKKNPFMIYATKENTPYNRFINWFYEDGYASYTAEEIKKVEDTLKAEMQSKGMSKEHKQYLHDVGQMTSGEKVIVPIVAGVGVIVVITIIILIKKKKAKKVEQTNGDLLFNEDDEDDEDF